MTNSTFALVFDIAKLSTVDGTGLRTTVFFKGCNLKCLWCHNPEGILPNPQMLFYKERCIGCNKCVSKCPNKGEFCTLCGNCITYCPTKSREICGKKYSIDDLMQKIIDDRIFYETSNGGVTFSGGECLLQSDAVYELLKRCKTENIHTAIDTAGNVPWSVFEKIIPYTDLFLYDMKIMDTNLHLKYTGVKNQLILENLSRLLSNKCKIWVRVPLIKNVNDSKENAYKMRDFFMKFGYPEKIEILPYNSMGEAKYCALGKTPPEFEVPTKEKITEFYNMLFY